MICLREWNNDYLNLFWIHWAGFFILVKWCLVQGQSTTEASGFIFSFVQNQLGYGPTFHEAVPAVGGQQSDSLVAYFGYIYCTDSAENTTNDFPMLSSYISYPYNPVGKVITILFMSRFFLFLFFSIFVIDLWSGDSEISTDSFRLICLPLLCERWVNKTGSSRNSETSFPTCAYWNYCCIWEKKGSTWCSFSFA